MFLVSDLPQDTRHKVNITKKCVCICFLWTGQYSTPSRPVKHKLLLIWFLSQLSICCNEIIHALSLGWSQWGGRPIIDRYAFHIQMSLVCRRTGAGLLLICPFSNIWAAVYLVGWSCSETVCVLWVWEISEWWLFSEI